MEKKLQNRNVLQFKEGKGGRIVRRIGWHFTSGYFRKALPCLQLLCSPINLPTRKWWSPGYDQELNFGKIFQRVRKKWTNLLVTTLIGSENIENYNYMVLVLYEWGKVKFTQINFSFSFWMSAVILWIILVVTLFLATSGLSVFFDFGFWDRTDGLVNRTCLVVSGYCLPVDEETSMSKLCEGLNHPQLPLFSMFRGNLPWNSSSRDVIDGERQRLMEKTEQVGNLLQGWRCNTS